MGNARDWKPGARSRGRAAEDYLSVIYIFQESASCCGFLFSEKNKNETSQTPTSFFLLVKERAGLMLQRWFIDEQGRRVKH